VKSGLSGQQKVHEGDMSGKRQDHQRLESDDAAAQRRDAAEAGYLRELGQRLRHLRAVRGMSRKFLAAASGLSERYIAQIESGAGNVSIILLKRVAEATGGRLEDLVPDIDADPTQALIRGLLRTATPAQMIAVKAALSNEAQSVARAAKGGDQRIALIGLRGAGKSTLGKLAAERLGWRFIELNAEIERERGFSMTDIFTLYGQDGYRRFEQETLRRIADEPGPMIVATGGGIVADPVTLDLLVTSFFTAWVRALPEEHMARVRGQGDMRPMANERSAMSELVTILSSREPLYARAHAVVDTTGRSVDDSVGALVDVVTRRAVA
jgi:XRE family transcriptional regulator, aerobic/anaerobic benzoate catabolism transcriptional regulator